MADRYLYLPMIGPSVLLSLALFGSLKDRYRTRWPTYVRWVSIVSGVVVVVLAVAGYTRSGIWKNNITLWTDTVTRLQHGIPYTNLGASYLEAGNVAEAKKYFEKSVEVMPDYYLAHQNLGRIALQENDLPAAEKYFSRVLSLNPNNPFVSQELSRTYLALGDLGRASGVINEGLKFAPNDPSLLNVKAHILVRKGEFEEAYKIYQTLTVVEPDSYSHWFNSGALLARLGRPDEAERALVRAINLNGKLPNAYQELASLFDKSITRLQQAARFEKVLKDFQNNSQALRHLSTLYLDRFPANVDRIIMIAQKSMERSPGDPNGLDILGQAYSVKGYYKKSLDYYKQALSALPDEPYFLYQVGITSRQAGETAAGNAYLKELVRKYPNHELSNLAKKTLKE